MTVVDKLQTLTVTLEVYILNRSHCWYTIYKTSHYSNSFHVI